MAGDATMLKTLTALLLLANLAFLAWVQGWLSPGLPPPGASEREPERLRLQVRPESVIVLSPQAASAALAPPAPAPAAEDAAPGEATQSSAGADGAAAPAAAPAATIPFSAGQNPGGPGERRQPGR